MDRHIECECGERIPVTGAMAGTMVRCRCGQEVEVPPLSRLGAAEGTSPDDPAGQPTSASQETPTDEKAANHAAAAANPLSNYPIAGVAGAVLLDGGCRLVASSWAADEAAIPLLIGGAMVIWDAIGRIGARITGASSAVLTGVILLHGACHLTASTSRYVGYDDALSMLLLLVGLLYVGGGAIGRWRQSRRRLQFSLATLLLATAGLAALIGSIAYIGQSRHRSEPIDRSWSTGTTEVGVKRTAEGVVATVDASWPDAAPGLYVRYALWLVDDKGDHQLMIGSAEQLNDFRHTGAVYFGSRLGKPCRAVFDYEIWEGMPNRGNLLAKNSAFSEWLSE